MIQRKKERKKKERKKEKKKKKKERNKESEFSILNPDLSSFKILIPDRD